MEAALAPATDWSKVADFADDLAPRFAHDDKLFVRFYSRPILLERVSDENGRPMYEDVDCIQIFVPGDKLNQIDRIASKDDIQRFQTRYDKYKAGAGQEVVGTRLEAVPWMSRSKVEEYKFFNIFTVEQLAAASDQVGQKFPGFQNDKQKAQKFLEATNGTDARVAELEAKIEKLLAAAAAKDEALAVVTSPSKAGK